MSADPMSHNEARRITNRLYELPPATDAGIIQKPDGYWIRTAEDLRRYLLDVTDVEAL